MLFPIYLLLTYSHLSIPYHPQAAAEDAAQLVSGVAVTRWEMTRRAESLTSGLIGSSAARLPACRSPRGTSARHNILCTWWQQGGWNKHKNTSIWSTARWWSSCILCLVSNKCVLRSIIFVKVANLKSDVWLHLSV